MSLRLSKKAKRAIREALAFALSHNVSIGYERENALADFYYSLNRHGLPNLETAEEMMAARKIMKEDLERLRAIKELEAEVKLDG
jgi:hypothetical protein